MKQPSNKNPGGIFSHFGGHMICWDGNALENNQMLFCCCCERQSQHYPTYYKLRVNLEMWNADLFGAA